MPRYVNDGNLKVSWITTAVDPAFVGQSVLLAGDDLECHLTKDGLNINFTENEVDDAALCETFDATLPGSFKVAIELTLKRRNTVGGDTDFAWNLFNTRGESGTLVVRRGIDADTDWATAQPIESYPVIYGIRRPAPSATNEQGRFMLSFYGTVEPELDGLVVAS